MIIILKQIEKLNKLLGKILIKKKKKKKRKYVPLSSVTIDIVGQHYKERAYI